MNLVAIFLRAKIRLSADEGVINDYRDHQQHCPEKKIINRIVKTKRRHVSLRSRGIGASAWMVDGTSKRDRTKPLISVLHNGNICPAKEKPIFFFFVCVYYG